LSKDSSCADLTLALFLLLALVSPGVGVVTFCTGEFSTSLSGAASFIAEPTFSADSSAAALFGQQLRRLGLRGRRCRGFLLLYRDPESD
jgi:hypothetical protein